MAVVESVAMRVAVLLNWLGTRTDPRRCRRITMRWTASSASFQRQRMRLLTMTMPTVFGEDPGERCVGGTKLSALVDRNLHVEILS